MAYRRSGSSTRSRYGSRGGRGYSTRRRASTTRSRSSRRSTGRGGVQTVRIELVGQAASPVSRTTVPTPSPRRAKY